ncbi:MAG TPA: ATP-binding protein [Pseudonocardiaceae bacterium]|nr:ATP-binding protein [Pseudonocardiaceae bacterium]
MALVVTGTVSWIVVVFAPPEYRAAAAWSLGSFALLLSAAAAAAAFGYARTRALETTVQNARAEADGMIRMATEDARAEVAHLRQRAGEIQAKADRAVRAAQDQSLADSARVGQQVAEAQAAAVAEVHALRAQADAEADLIAEQVIPALVERLQSGSSASTALAEIELPASDWGRRVVRFVAEHVGRVERAKVAALAACANAASRMQAQATSMAAELRDMEDTADPATLARLLEVDHHNAQLGRLADSIAVLTRARSGRRWARPIPMENVLRGAISRISDYRRVQLHAPVEVAILGYAAEGVIHLLAELIDNAAQFSPPTEQVHVYVEEAHTGVVVAIEDSGIGMRPRALARAEAAISAPIGDLSGVSGTRLGLAVVGQLARKHDLTVSYRPSARGGVGVVVMIPRHLVTGVPQLSPALPAVRGELVAGGGSEVRRSTAVLAPEDTLPDPDQPFELAKRQPGRTLARVTERASTTPQPNTSRTDPGAAFGAFQRAAGDNDTERDTRPDDGAAAQP